MINLCRKCPNLKRVVEYHDGYYEIRVYCVNSWHENCGYFLIPLKEKEYDVSNFRPLLGNNEIKGVISKMIASYWKKIRRELNNGNMDYCIMMPEYMMLEMNR